MSKMPTASQDSPAVGIVSDSPLERHRLQKVVVELGYRVHCSREPDRFQSPENLTPEPAAWLLVIKDEELWEEPYELFLEYAQAPLLMAEESPEQLSGIDLKRWQRRIATKLNEACGPPLESITRLESPAPDSPQDSDDRSPPSAPRLQLDRQTAVPLPFPAYLTQQPQGQAIDRVVLLAASLGGPEAVKQFLDVLPPGLPVGFVYAQHNDAEAMDVLLRVLGRHANYPLRNATDGQELKSGEVLVAPITQSMTVDAQKVVHLSDTPWKGPYRPCIDQVLLTIGDCFRDRTWVIAFSGMGEDGARAAPILHAYGARIWCQDSESCASNSMVEAISRTGCVSERGNPAALAEKLLKSLENDELLSKRKSSRGELT